MARLIIHILKTSNRLHQRLGTNLIVRDGEHYEYGVFICNMVEC